jgi:cation:H+ antiporter
MSLFNFANYTVGINLVIFAVAAGAVCFSGARLSIYADKIADRTSLGRAFIGVLLLGGASSLPEMATTATASAIGNAPLATNNLLGEIPMQMGVLALVDLVMVKGALTFFAPHPVLLLAGVLLTILLALTLAGIAAGEIFTLFDVGLWSSVLFVTYIISLYTMQRYENQDYWRPVNLPDEPTPATQQRQERLHSIPLKRIYSYFALNSLVVLLAGWTVAQVGNILAAQTDLGGSFVGATLLAVATSLPEAIVTISAVRLRAFDMAMSNIFGSNALTVAIFFIADIFYRQGAILEATDRSAIFMGGLAIILTCVYLWGLLERENRTVYRMGVDSAIVLSIYLGGLIVFYLLSFPDASS